MKDKRKPQKTPLATASRDEGQAMNWQWTGTELKQRRGKEIKRRATNRGSNWRQIETREHKANLFGKKLQSNGSEQEKQRNALNYKRIAQSTIEFRRIEIKGEKREEIRDDQCGLQKHHAAVESRSTIGKETTFACVELEWTCNGHQRKAMN